MYKSPHQFPPMLPAEHRFEPLRERAAAVVNLSAELSGTAHPATRDALRDLLRSMNSYYSNRIEGQSTTPKNIDAALHDDFSPQPEIAQLQRIAVAHIEAEKHLDSRNKAAVSPMKAEFAQVAHHALYSRLKPEDRTTKDGVVI